MQSSDFDILLIDVTFHIWFFLKNGVKSAKKNEFNRDRRLKV